MKDIPNWERGYELDGEGDLIPIDRRVSSVLVRDHEGKELCWLPVASCATHSEIRLRQMEYLWTHYRTLDWTLDETARALRKLFHRVPDEVERFLGRTAPGALR